jgi:alcohol dehydrogenase (cytochrome c)
MVPGLGRAAVRWLLAAAFASGWLSSGPVVSADDNQASSTVVRPVNTPATNDWPVYGGNYFNQRYSALNQINKSNVQNIRGVCRFQIGIDRDLLVNSSFENSPIVVNGTMFVSGALDQVLAVDAATCDERWKYEPDLLDINLLPLCCGFINRGVAVGDNKVFIAQLDAKLVALNQENGDVVWKVPATGNPADNPFTGYSETMAPQFWQTSPNGRGLVIVGASGGEYEARGRVTAFDSQTGAVVWQFFTTNQPVPRTDGPEGNDAQSGGPVWQTPPIDPELGLLFVNTGNPGPDVAGSVRPGPNQASDSIVALDLNTGQPRAGWGVNPVTGTPPGMGFFQEIHHDIWDLDAASPVILFDIPTPAGPIKALGQAGKTGWVYLLDRTTGVPLPYAPAPETPVPQEPTQLTNPTQPTMDPTAAFVPNNPANIALCTPPVVYRGVLLSPVPIFTPFNEAPQLICPAASGGSEWSPHSFNQQTNLMYVCGINQPMVYTRDPEQLNQPVLREGSAFIPPPTARQYGTLTALDVTTNKIRWQRGGTNPADPVFQRPCVGGSLTTAGGLVFIGEHDGNLDAFDADNGNLLFRFQMDAGVNAPPITYSVRGRQFVAVAVGGNSIQDYPRGDTVWVLALNGDIGPTQPPAPPQKPVAREIEVKIKDFQFQPFEIHVPPGATVTWINDDDTDHTTTADRDPKATPPYEWSSQLMRPGDQFSHTFVRPDIYPYHCNPHPTMLGRVVVDPTAPVEGRVVRLKPVTDEADPDAAPDLMAAVSQTLDLDTGRDTLRLPRVNIDQDGEATVQFALRSEGGDPGAVQEGGMDDLLKILRAIHQSTDAGHITNTTVLGTYPVERKGGVAPETVVLRAVVSAEKAAQIDWDALTPQDLPNALEIFWEHPALAGNTELADRIAEPDSERQGTPQTIAEVRPVVNAMLAHLNRALEGLSSSDVRIARSQVRQFLTNWDDVNDELSGWYPESYVSLEAEVERTQAALLDQVPEDTVTARASLLALRAGMAEVMQNLNEQEDAGP